MKRGEIYYIKSNYAETGHEVRGDRPAVIVSNDKCNEFSPVVEVVFLTTQPKKPLPTHVQIFSAARPSTVQCEQICSVAKERVENYQGKLTEDELVAVNHALAISLGIDVGIIFDEDDSTEEEAEDYEKFDFEASDEDWSHAVTKISAERDIYKELYNDLLNRLTREEERE